MQGAHSVLPVWLLAKDSQGARWASGGEILRFAQDDMGNNGCPVLLNDEREADDNWLRMTWGNHIASQV